MAWISRWVPIVLVSVAACGGQPAPPNGEGDAGVDGGGPPGDSDGETSTGAGSEGASGAITLDGGSVPSQCEGTDDGWGESGGEDEGSGDGGSGTGGNTLGMDDDMPLAANVYGVQMGEWAPNDLIALEGVVVTTPSTFSETGTGWELFVQEPEGGQFSGLRVRAGSHPGASVVPGTEVALVGRVRVQNGFFLLELVDTAEALSVGGSIALPEPDLVSAEILTPDNPDARPYEGVPVRVEQVMVVDADPCEGELLVGNTLRVDDRFAPGALPTLAEGQVITAVEGVLVYAVDAYELAPVSADGIE